MAVLGNTLTLIAGEKAGIIKPGIPVVSAPQADEALTMLKKVSAKRHAPLTLVGRDVTFEAGVHSLDGQNLSIENTLRVRCRKSSIPSGDDVINPVILRIPLLGAHQVVNAATAYAALKASGLEISDKAIRKGFAKVCWPCRFEIVRREPPVVIDSAHNTDSARRLRQALDDYFPGWPVIWIFAILEDKDAAGMLTELAPRLTQVIATQADHPRALEVEKIVVFAQQAGIPVEAVKSPSAALARALELASDHAIVLSAGSVAFAGEVKTAWQKLNLQGSTHVSARADT
jgi:dihydrofolate synthase/folylpolyglutamate synthase